MTKAPNMTPESEWWFPRKADAAWVAEIRDEDPDETAGMDDEDVIDKYAYGRRYVVTWDHLGDAYDQYEALVDEYIALLEIVRKGQPPSERRENASPTDVQN